MLRTKTLREALRMIVFVTTADTEILALSRVARDLPDGFPALKGVNPTRLPDTLAVEHLADGASLVLVRLLGGRQAWEAGFDALAAHCRRTGIPFLAWSGEPYADAELTAASTAPAAIVAEAFAYLCHGGVDNLKQLLFFLSDTLLMTGYGFEPPQPLPEYGIYHPAFAETVALSDYLEQRWATHRPAVGILFYRAHCLSSNTDFIDALIAEIERQGGNVLPVFCASLRLTGSPPPAFQALLLDPQGQPRVDCLVSTLSHSMGAVPVHGAAAAEAWSVAFLESLNLPMVQAIACTSSQQEWQQDDNGLTPIDTAMTVAMPEFDGRIISVPFSFKEVIPAENLVGSVVTQYVPVPDRVQAAIGLAMRLARLRHIPNAAKRVAILLSSYPTKTARIGNAVGLDSPASLLLLLQALRQDGYDLGAAPLPPDSDSLIQSLIASGTYDAEFLTDAQLSGAVGQVHSTAYQHWYERWPAPVQTALQETWGTPPGDMQDVWHGYPPASHGTQLAQRPGSRRGLHCLERLRLYPQYLRRRGVPGMHDALCRDVDCRAKSGQSRTRHLR